MQAKITKRVVDAANSRGVEYQVLDTEIPGFGLRVRSSGSKSFFIQYRRQGRLVRCSIGLYPDLTAIMARDIARKLREKVVSGEDPLAERRAQKAILTISELCDLYLVEGCETKKASTIYTDRGRIRRHIKPLLGRRRITDISRADIENFMRDIAKGKTATDEKTKLRGRAIVKGGRGTAARTVGLLGAIIQFAIRRDLIDQNPVRGVKRYPDKKGERFLSEQELVRLGIALSDIAGPGSSIIRLLILTGCRRGEILQLRWDEVDFENRCLRLTDSKTGNRIVPLGPPALSLLAQIPKGKESHFVFPAIRGKGYYGNLPRIWNRVRSKAELHDVRLHDLRHSFASFAVSGGVPLAVVGAILGHKSAATTERYSHLSDDPIRRATDATSRLIEEVLDRDMRNVKAR